MRASLLEDRVPGLMAIPPGGIKEQVFPSVSRRRATGCLEVRRRRSPESGPDTPTSPFGGRQALPE
eukprot:11461831-Alexandrium_andersonii.AAC.1